MKFYLESILIVLILVLAGGTSSSQTITLQWDPSTDPDVVGYNLYYGVTSQVYTNFVAVGLAATATVSNLTSGLIYYFAATTINSAGLESDFSGEVSFEVGLPLCSILVSNLTQTYDGTPKTLSVSTTPPGLLTAVTYAGLLGPPTACGSYPVTVAIVDPNYVSSVTETLVISPSSATVQLNSLDQVYDGTSKSVLVSTTPPGLAVNVTYIGLLGPPIDAGSYQVLATIVDTNYSGTASGTLVVEKTDAIVQLVNLNQVYDGKVKPVQVITLPPGLDVVLTYNGQTAPPSAVGTYAVVATLNDPSYAGSAMDWLTISPAPSKSAPLNPISSNSSSWVGGGTAPPGGAVLQVSWPKIATGITIWQSADLVTWTLLTNLAGSQGSQPIVGTGTGPVFFRATTAGAAATNAVPLSIGRPGTSSTLAY